MENIDVVAAKARNIVCLNSPEGNRDAVGEQAIGMLLSLFNNIIRANSEVRNGKWLREENRGLELRGKTVGIIGFGNVGSSFAEKLSGFGCRILAYDKYKSDYAPVHVHETDLKTITNEADIVSFHVPLTDETRYMANEQFFSSCKDGVYIINTSRGKVLNTHDLVEAMKMEKVMGACLDVLEYEKVSFEDVTTSNPDFDWLCQSDRVVLTPHIAGWTYESNIKLSTVLARKIIQLFGSNTN
jgi:D-3-phosphoglycerate dehydrogenase